MVVLVCGGRAYQNRTRVFYVLSKLHAERPITHVIHGAATGADTLAGEWARMEAIPCTEYPADWATHGRAGGVIRNQHMLEAGPDLVVAFPGGRGTRDMITRAGKAGVEVLAR